VGDAGRAVHNAALDIDVPGEAFRRRLHQDLTEVLDLLARGAVSPQIAARFPLTEAAAAMELAESRTVRGKVILEPTRGARSATGP
jgi:NADPH:quinone reductase-like Zn-dependent oxidoreductase